MEIWAGKECEKAYSKQARATPRDRRQQQFNNFNRHRDNNNMAELPHGDCNDIHNPSQQYLTWNRINLPTGSIIPPRRSGAASVVVKGKLYMFGVSIYLFVDVCPRFFSLELTLIYYLLRRDMEVEQVASMISIPMHSTRPIQSGNVLLFLATHDQDVVKIMVWSLVIAAGCIYSGDIMVARG